jgi:hypothetical protein
MSGAEVNEAIDKMSDAEQIEVRAYLQSKLPGTEEWRREMSRRLDDMEAGEKFTSAQVEALVAKLEAEGR